MGTQLLARRGPRHGKHFFVSLCRGLPLGQSGITFVVSHADGAFFMSFGQVVRGLLDRTAWISTGLPLLSPVGHNKSRWKSTDQGVAFEQPSASGIVRLTGRLFRMLPGGTLNDPGAY